MGLGAPKKRLKLSQDPNNTAWSRSTTTFGHKILTSQGWNPGEYLGARDANHAEHYTAANASHIRAVLREDNLGLGAKIGSGNADNFGLSMLAGLLGRLNGKSEEVLEKQEAARRDVELRTYQAQKYGFMNFVSGGFLVGDRIQSSVESPAVVKTEDSLLGTDGAALAKQRKRKRVDQSDRSEQLETAELNFDKKEKKRKERKPTTGGLPNPALSGDESIISGQKSGQDTLTEDAKSKKRREKAERKALKAAVGNSAVSSDNDNARLKDEKRARREERRRRKEAKRKELVAVKSDAVTTADAPSAVDKTTSSAVSSAAVKNVPQIFGRQAVRQRYIQQKRMASMDAQALKEIFMIQAAS